VEHPTRDLQHSCATLLFAQGVEAATVQHILGHGSITVTTSIYVDVIEQVQHDALSKLDGSLPTTKTTTKHRLTSGCRQNCRQDDSEAVRNVPETASDLVVTAGFEPTTP